MVPGPDQHPEEHEDQFGGTQERCQEGAQGLGLGGTRMHTQLQWLPGPVGAHARGCSTRQDGAEA